MIYVLHTCTVACTKIALSPLLHHYINTVYSVHKKKSETSVVTSLHSKKGSHGITT